MSRDLAGGFSTRILPLSQVTVKAKNRVNMIDQKIKDFSKQRVLSGILVVTIVVDKSNNLEI